MGIDISGSMYVGAWKGDFDESTINFPEDWDEDDWQEYLEDNDISSVAPYFDADVDDCFFGIGLPDTPLDEEALQKWLHTVHSYQKKFESIVGVPAMLVGMQKVY